MSQQDTTHTHDLVRVEDEQNQQAWTTCKTCTYRSDAEPWQPLQGEELQAFLDDFNAKRAADAQLRALAEAEQNGTH